VVLELLNNRFHQVRLDSYTKRRGMSTIICATNGRLIGTIHVSLTTTDLNDDNETIKGNKRKRRVSS
jgi:hypothetical protein